MARLMDATVRMFGILRVQAGNTAFGQRLIIDGENIITLDMQGLLIFSCCLDQILCKRGK